MPTQIYFIDTKLDNYQTIINSLASTDKYFLIDSSSDGLTQISNIVSSYKDIDSIHIFSHGSIGAINLGNTIYSNENISLYETQLQAIGSSLTSSGDIFLYGCNVGQDELGLNFINQIAQFTQADVASSNDLTGNRVLGGDWDLEVRSGIVETNVVVENGGTVVIGGVFITKSENTVDKVPLLGDIPFLGWLFKVKTDKGERRELLVFITPRVISDKMRVD